MGSRARRSSGSEGWEAWLATRRHFRRYSLANQSLIVTQRPEATYVAGFRKWLALGYAVKKGEKAIRVCVPMPPSRKAIERWEREGGALEERPRTFFKLGPVFDRAQVAPLPPPAIPVALDPPIRELGGDELAPVLPCLIGLAGEIGCTVEFETMTGEDGYYTPSRRRIAIREGMAVNAQAATLVHELGHALLHAEPPQDTPALGRAAEEMVVESVAFTVCGALGFDTPGSSIPYLAVWAEAAEADTIERTAGLIDGLARRIEAAALPREGEEVQTVRWAAPQLAF